MPRFSRLIALAAMMAVLPFMNGCSGCSTVTNSSDSSSTTTKQVLSPEEKMAKKTCGGDPDSEKTVLGISLGMKLSDAEAILRCYDPKANFVDGTTGEYTEVSKYLKEKSGGTTDFYNMDIWTRGTVRDCNTSVGNSNSLLDESLRPDDQRFSSWIYSGVNKRSHGFPCFSKLTDQVALLADGAPDQMVVTGIWRISIPVDGVRPTLDFIANAFSSRFPALGDINRSSDGLWGEGFLDVDNKKLNGPQIRSDYQSSPPKAPASLGWFPSDAEKVEHERKVSEYAMLMAIYTVKMEDARLLLSCVNAAPSQSGFRPTDGTNERCGISYYVGAKSYPGGYADAFFMGIYNEVAAREGLQKLRDYLRTQRGVADDSRKPVL